MRTKPKDGPIWVPCPDCDDWWCRKHRQHTGDCPCPPIDVWAEAGIDPYSEGLANADDTKNYNFPVD